LNAMTSTPDKQDAGAAGPAGLAGLLLPGGALLLTFGMILVVAGVVIAPLFRPGTWVILLALLVMAAGGLVTLARPD